MPCDGRRRVVRGSAWAPAPLIAEAALETSQDDDAEDEDAGEEGDGGVLAAELALPPPPNTRLKNPEPWAEDLRECLPASLKVG